MNARSCSMKEIYKLIYRKEMLLLATALNLFPNNTYLVTLCPAAGTLMQI